MKKITLIALCIACAASLALAQSEVRSKNAVGYIKKTVPAGKLVTATIPFNSMDGSDTFGATTIAQDMPVNSSVFFWNPTSQSWVGGGKSGKGWAPAQANYVLKPGESFFLKGPAGAETIVTITGEVPDDDTLKPATVGNRAISSVANPYPVEMTWGTSALANSLSVNSSVFFWNPESQSWVGGGKSGKGWSPAQANYVVAPGEGFFIREASANTNVWNEVKPYTWP